MTYASGRFFLKYLLSLPLLKVNISDIYCMCTCSVPLKALLEADVHARAGLRARAHRPRAPLRRPRIRRVLAGDRARLPRPERRRRPEARHGEGVS